MLDGCELKLWKTHWASACLHTTELQVPAGVVSSRELLLTCRIALVSSVPRRRCALPLWLLRAVFCSCVDLLHPRNLLRAGAATSNRCLDHCLHLEQNLCLLKQ